MKILKFNFDMFELQNDTFQCNVRRCINPKFVEAKKVIDHLERNHGSITQVKLGKILIDDQAKSHRLQ